MKPDPIARGQAAARAVLAQDRRDRFAVLQGGGESTLRREPAQVPAQMVRLATDDVRLLLAALATPGVPTKLAAIGDRIGEQVHPCLLPGSDDCPPAGIARPTTDDAAHALYGGWVDTPGLSGADGSSVR